MKAKIFDRLTIFVAELFGTGLLVYFGCMSCIQWPGSDNNPVGSAFSFGLLVGIIVQLFGCISGAHINPAISVAAFIFRVIDLPMMCLYVVAQMTGAFMGFGLLKTVTPAYVFEKVIGAGNTENVTVPGFCTTMPRADISPYQATLVEFTAVSILILLCCSVWDPRNVRNTDSTPIKFGICIAILGYTIGPITGGSINPARSFAPSIWNGDFRYQWVYWVASISAGIIIPIVYKKIFWRDVVKQHEVIPQIDDDKQVQLKLISSN